jgi:hypothetical protein
MWWFKAIVLVVGMTGGSVRLARAAEPADPATLRPARDRAELPGFGLSLPVPAGFRRDTDGDRSIAQFVPEKQRGNGLPEQLLIVDFFPRGTKSLAEWAVESSKAEKGRVTIVEDAKWGDRPAVEVRVARGPERDGEHVGARVLFAEQGRYVYRVIYSVVSARVDDVAGYDELVRGTRWSEVARPGKAVRMRLPMLRLPNGMVVSIPEPFRPDMQSKSKLIVTFIAHDWAEGGAPVSKLLVIPLPPPRLGQARHTPAAVKTEFEQNMVGSFQMTEPFRWTDDAGGAFAVTQAAKTERGWVRALVAVTAADRATVFALECRPGQGGAESVAGLERALEALRASIEDGLKEAK